MVGDEAVKAALARWGGSLRDLDDLDLALWSAVVSDPFGEHDDSCQEGALRALAWAELGGELLRRRGHEGGNSAVFEGASAALAAFLTLDLTPASQGHPRGDGHASLGQRDRGAVGVPKARLGPRCRPGSRRPARPCHPSA